jgi:tRNA pseudouridine32 synthase/23S rRNA pseudouridine746 synthase
MTRAHRDDGWIYNPPTEPWLDILHLDNDLIVIHKPAGLLSVPGRREDHQDSAFTRILERFPYARISHRLDMDTSGVMAVGLHRRAERALDRQFQKRVVEKRYLARVIGHPAQDEGVIELPLRRLSGELGSVVCQEGKPSTTRYEVLSRDDGTALVALYPLTGRSHQLRVHLSAIGHPIVGDRFYAPSKPASARMLLHAETLTLLQPTSGERLTIQAPPPERLRSSQS